MLAFTPSSSWYSIVRGTSQLLSTNPEQSGPGPEVFGDQLSRPQVYFVPMADSARAMISGRLIGGAAASAGAGGPNRERASVSNEPHVTRWAFISLPPRIRGFQGRCV